jgi:hypothetical protein
MRVLFGLGKLEHLQDAIANRLGIWSGRCQDCGHAATPNRDFRLSRPLLSNVDTMDFTARSV